MQFLCPFDLTGNQKRMVCSINNIRGGSLTKKELEKMNAFTRLVHLLHHLPPNYTHVLICWEDKNEKKDNSSFCQTNGKKIIKFHGKMSDNPSKKPTLLPLADRQDL